MADRNNPIERNPASGRPLMRDIAPKFSRPAPRVVEKKPVKTAAKNVPLGKLPEINKEKRKFNLPKLKNAVILFGAIIFLAGAAIFTKSLAEVKVSVTPRQAIVDVNSNLEAFSNSSSPISLEIVSAGDTVELDGDVGETSAGTQKASGQIVIFNGYSTEPQTLVASTRFEAPGGKIYRIRNGVTVPGGKNEKGKLVPGQLEVSVYADKPGAEYNIGLSDFTIPGFSGTPKFEKIYARSKAEMTGGSSGGAKIVTQGIVNNLLIQAQEDFRKNIKSRMQKDLPEGVYIPEGAIDVKITLLSADPKINSEADKVHIKAKISAQVAVFKTKDISKALAAKYLDVKGGEEILVGNLDNLDFQVLNKNFGEKRISFKISGQARFVWLFDQDALKRDLSAVSRQARQDVFKNYPAIDRAEIVFSPPWLRFFPSDPDKIKLDYPSPVD